MAKAQKTWTKLCRFIIMAIMFTALCALNFILGCDPDKDPEPKYYYGPAPGDIDQPGQDITADDIDSQDLILPDAGKDSEPMVYYGPAPSDLVTQTDAPEPKVDVVEDVPNENDLEPVVPYYGPQPFEITETPTDVLEDVPQDTAPELMPTWYGPMPQDVVDNEVDHPDAEPKVDEFCEPMAYYGPPPCDTDEACKEQYGEGWYCDKENTFGDGCGNESN